MIVLTLINNIFYKIVFFIFFVYKMLCLFFFNSFFFSTDFFFFDSFFFSSFFFLSVLKNNLFIVFYIIIVLIKILSIFIAVAFFTVAERKILGAIHRRRGPNMVGFWGLLQPIADALKLFLKELLIPVKSNRFIFLAAPFWILLLSVFGWVVIPFNSSIFFSNNSFKNLTFLTTTDLDFFFSFFSFFPFFSVDIKNGVLFLLAISSLNVYGIILSGWSSNSKYAFFGGLRSAAQMISYEVSMGLTILPVVMFSNSFNFTDIVFFQKNSSWFLFSLFPCFFIFLISMLAETNRTPFDLPEAEAELVAGYNVEYSAITFAMFFLGEYSSMILMATFNVILFVGGWSVVCVWVFSLKILFFCFFYILIRATVPRYRYDQLMQVCWKNFLPISLGFFMFSSSLIVFFSQIL
jgi:NADH-quinone oxidoreductase subunit H